MIEGTELDHFLLEFVSSSLLGTTSVEALSATALELLRRDLLDAFDDNRDGKLSIQEVRRDIYLVICHYFSLEAHIQSVLLSYYANLRVYEYNCCYVNFYKHLKLSQILPVEENFLLLFGFENRLESSVEFIKASRNQNLVVVNK